MEILLGTLRMKDLVRDEKRSHEMYDALRDAKLDGMMLFDDSLAKLYRDRVIDYETG
ncbi:MAG: hypothetical protein R2880_03725 [Deinococcales bacterium]